MVDYELTLYIVLFISELFIIILNTLFSISITISACKTGYGKEKPPPGVSRHVFPINPEQRLKWIRAIPRKNLNPTHTSVICSLHFVDSDFRDGKFGL